MKKGLFTLLLVIITALPALAAPTNTSGPWGILVSKGSGFTNLSTAKRSPATASKTMVIADVMDCNNLTIPADRAIDVKKGGRIRYSGDLVINGPFNAGMYQALEKVGSGTLTFGPGSVSSIPPAWFTGSDTVAVQSAVTTSKNSGWIPLKLDRMYTLTASINIDRQVDTGGIDNSWFVISGGGVGGFYTASAIKLFDTTLAYTTEPLTSQIKFENVIFEADAYTTDAYVISQGYLRTTFAGCAFKKIKLANYTTTYIQSISLDNCVARAWGGTFLAAPIAYNFQFHNTTLEAGESIAHGGSNGFLFIDIRGSGFTGGAIEGLSGYGISYGSARGFYVGGPVYFEGNTDSDIKGTDGTKLTAGVAIIGNHFHNDPAKTAKSIVWSGFTQGCVSYGNTLNSDGTLHSLAVTDQVDISDSTAGGDIANYNRRHWFMDKKYRDKGGYIYGSTSDGDNAYLNLGVRYDSNTQYDLISLLWTQKIVLRGADYIPSGLNLAFAGATESGFTIKNSNVSNSGQYINFANSANGSAGEITQTGATTIAYTTTSDYRLKDNIHPISNATDSLMLLKPVDYSWKSDGSTGQGFIAHELQSVIPYAVVGEKDAVNADGSIKTQSIDMAKVVPVLTAALQELRKEFETYKLSHP
ncbi:MAG: tail fiber domain-containing protein [Desulfuromonadaceae bacterium]